MSYGFKIMVEGDYACFSRPELKVERVSYDVPTPGALEGMLKSVYWKPSIRYVLDKIIVFQAIDFVNIRRNEVKDKVLLSAVKSQMNKKGGDPCIYTARFCKNHDTGRYRRCDRDLDRTPTETICPPAKARFDPCP